MSANTSTITAAPSVIPSSSFYRGIIHTQRVNDIGEPLQFSVEFFFNFVDEVEIPVLAEPLITESTLKRRKRRNLYGHTVFCSTRETMVSYNR